MRIKLLHGSEKQKLNHLMPFSLHGANGCHDGVGVNLTDNAKLAHDYATRLSEGSIYIIDLDTSKFLPINKQTFLNKEQAKVITKEIDLLPKKYQYRLYSDFLGKEVLELESRDEAIKVYKKYKDIFTHEQLELDRLKPTAEQITDNLWEISIPRGKGNIAEVNTEHLHYCLMLFDNHHGTNMLKKISEGLILPKGLDFNNYLSFSNHVPIHIELDNTFLIKENAVNLMQKFINKKESPQNDISVSFN
jgi:hypothetical protein